MNFAKNKIKKNSKMKGSFWDSTLWLKSRLWIYGTDLKKLKLAKYL